MAFIGTPLDTRIHFCWIQTARTGKTTMFDFLQPTWLHLFDVVNDFPQTEQYRDIWNKQRGTLSGVDKFNIQNPDAFTDQALLGTIKIGQPNPDWVRGEENLDINGNPMPEEIDINIKSANLPDKMLKFPFNVPAKFLKD